MKKLLAVTATLLTWITTASAQENATPALQVSLKTELAMPYKLYGMTIFEGSSRLLYLDANYGNFFGGTWIAQPNNGFENTELNYYLGYAWTWWADKPWQADVALATFYAHYTDPAWDGFFEFAADASFPKVLPWQFVPSVGLHRFENFDADPFTRGWLMPMALERAFDLPTWPLFQDDQTVTVKTETLWSDGVFGVESGWHNVRCSIETTYNFGTVDCKISGGHQWSLQGEEDEWLAIFSVSYAF